MTAGHDVAGVQISEIERLGSIDLERPVIGLEWDVSKFDGQQVLKRVAPLRNRGHRSSS